MYNEDREKKLESREARERSCNVKNGILKDITVMRTNREFSVEDIRYLHVSNEPSMIGLKMRQDMVVWWRLRRAKG